MSQRPHLVQQKLTGRGNYWWLKYLKSIEGIQEQLWDLKLKNNLDKWKGGKESECYGQEQLCKSIKMI